ncbi:hypothetical protein GMSM_43410 [Geomonas sp. Red276]
MKLACAFKAFTVIGRGGRINDFFPVRKVQLFINPVSFILV